MTDLAERRMTLAEFLDWNDGTDTRYELIDGRPVAMAPPSANHGVIAARLSGLLFSQLKPPCTVVHEAGLPAPDSSTTYFQADLVITCTPLEGRQVMTPDPLLIVEILSPSTEDHDRGRKLYAYRHIPSVQEILLVSSEQRHVEHWRRIGAKWEVEDLIGEAVVPLPGLGLEPPLAEIYANSGV